MMCQPIRLAAAGLAAIVLAAALPTGAAAQDAPRQAPKVRSIPFVSITKSDGSTR